MGKASLVESTKSDITHWGSNKAYPDFKAEQGIPPWEMGSKKNVQEPRIIPGFTVSPQFPALRRGKKKKTKPHKCHPQSEVLF